VTAISTSSGPAQNVADLQNRSTFLQSKSTESNPWICYDFKKLQVTPTHYALLSWQGSRSDYYHPKSWYFEGSNDGTNWTVLHNCPNNSDLNGATLIGLYRLSNSMKCRFVRIRQTQHHCNNTIAYLMLAAFELHGIFHEP
jgi:hypothetical protein